MGDFQASTTVDADANALFDYLSQVSNLPRYFARMTSAEPGDGAEVQQGLEEALATVKQLVEQQAASV
jgi:uncharacterized protein YndB with AHSA1/START domain